MTYAERTIIVTAEWQPLAQELCAAIAEGAAGENMFTTGLSSTGSFPATHYVSNGPIAEEFADLLPLTTYTEEGGTTEPGNVAAIEYLAAQAGLTVEPGAVAALLESAHVTDVAVIGPFEVFAKLDLKIAQEATE